jgi:hypothetical protein
MIFTNDAIVVDFSSGIACQKQITVQHNAVDILK